MEKILKDVTS